ncbi:DUF3887 domain-containing protein [Streptomyces iconiensis]|uniref:DUF3887 domain-containing protein n=1 Tax=Streptomyces iconiensis TaxID=1384038 RepID=A0ABT7A398_9ACTN|nr:DUF3887 domain-containing protein [Streptomyces iconiensis]MDJ1135118.1 DUF3887 domain-containing protein [Streptomyces iconiensis]
MSSPRSELAALAANVAALASQLADVVERNNAVPADLAGVRIARDLEALSDIALRMSVDRARAVGHTWKEVGDLLGVSRQAAFQRFGRPIDPRAGEPMSNAALPDAANRATELFVYWVEGQHDEIFALFDPTMTAQLPPDQIAAAWAQVIGMVGAYERMGKPLVRQLGDHTVVDIPMEFEAGQMKGRVTFNKEGQVSGLFILTPETP